MVHGHHNVDDGYVGYVDDGYGSGGDDDDDNVNNGDVL